LSSETFFHALYLYLPYKLTKALAWVGINNHRLAWPSAVCHGPGSQRSQLGLPWRSPRPFLACSLRRAVSPDSTISVYARFLELGRRANLTSRSSSLVGLALSLRESPTALVNAAVWATMIADVKRVCWFSLH